VVGDPDRAAAAEASLTRLRELYWSKGYNEARSEYQVAVDRSQGVLDLHFNIEEGKRSVVAAIDVNGAQETTSHLVSSEVEIKTGEPLDLSALSRWRKNLYSTRAFALVDITRNPLGDEAEPPAAAAHRDVGKGSAEGIPTVSSIEAASLLLQQPVDVPVRVNVAVREGQPFQIQNGASFDTERGPGVIVNIANHNSLGKAREIGLQTRYDSQIPDARIYFSPPTPDYFPLEAS